MTHKGFFPISSLEDVEYFKNASHSPATIEPTFPEGMNHVC